MFGPKIYIKTKETGVLLAPYKKSATEIFADLSSSAKVRMYTGGPYGDTIESQNEIYDGMIHNKTSVTWGIFPDGLEGPVGYTSLHNISYDGSCAAEYMIVDQNWWGKGIGTQMQIASVWYAIKHLNRNIIYASLAEKNIGSLKILQNLGFFVTGKKIRQYFRNGEYSDGLFTAFINTDRVNLLYPEGLPEEYKKYVDIAKKTIDLANKNCVLI